MTLINRLTPAATGVEWVRIFYLHPAGLELRHAEEFFCAFSAHTTEQVAI